MNKEDYDENMCTLLQLEGYKRLKKDPILTVERKISNVLEKKGDLIQEQRQLTPRQSLAPQIYGLPKIHKSSVPLRPIVCTIGSLTYYLPEELSRILSPLVGLSGMYNKNLTHFVEKIPVLKLKKLIYDEL